MASQTTTSLRSVLGPDFATGFRAGKAVRIDLGARLGWIHELADTARSMTAAFAAAPGANFTVQGAMLPRNSALVGLSLTASVNRNFALFASYDGEPGGGSRNNQLWGGIKLRW